MNFGSCGKVVGSNKETHHSSLCFMFASFNKGFRELLWRLRSPSLNLLCSKLLDTPNSFANFFIVDLLCKGILAIADRSTWSFCPPHFVAFLEETSTGWPYLWHSFALSHIRLTLRRETWNCHATIVVLCLFNFQWELLASYASYMVDFALKSNFSFYFYCVVLVHFDLHMSRTTRLHQTQCRQHGHKQHYFHIFKHSIQIWQLSVVSNVDIWNWR